MEEPSGLEPNFRHALHRIDKGLLSRSDILLINQFLKRTRHSSNGDSDSGTLAYDTLFEVSRSFNKFMYQRVLLPSAPALERYIRSIVKNLRWILRHNKDLCSVDQLLRSHGVGLFDLALLDPGEHRMEQLPVLKTLIGDSKFVLSPVFAKLISPFLGTITTQEFQGHISQEIIRLIKRGHKGIIFTLRTLQEHMNCNSMVESVIEITENIKNNLTQHDVPVFSPEQMPLGNEKYIGDLNHIVREVIHWFSKTAFSTPQCKIAEYIKTQVESFEGYVRNSVTDQEINSILILLLLPENINATDVDAVSKFVEDARATIIKTAKSHPSESVQIQFISIIGRLLNLVPDADLENFLVDIVLNQARPLGNGIQKNRDDRLNEKYLTGALRSLRLTIGTDCVRNKARSVIKANELNTAMSYIINFCHGKPVYKNCLIEALHVKLQLASITDHESIVTPNMVSVANSDPIKMLNVMEALQVHHQDPLAHLFICKNALNGTLFNMKDVATMVLMEIDNVPAMVDAASEATENRLYATVVELYEELCKTKEHLKHPVLESFYSRKEVEDQLKGFTDAIEEQHVYGILLAILHSPPKVKCMNTIRMLLDAWLRHGNKRRLFTVLIHCLLFRSSLMGFESTSQLAQIINSRSCKAIPALKPLRMDEGDVFAIVSHAVAEGSVPYILEHYLAAQDADVSPLLRTLLDDIKVVVNELSTFEKEDIEIYLASPDKMYLDSRPYQPSLTQTDKKKHANLTKQQLDDMRYKDQCAIRHKIASLINKVNAAVYALSRAFAHKREYLSLFLHDTLNLCKSALRLTVLYSPFSLVVDILCRQCFVGGLLKTVSRVSHMLKHIYSDGTTNVDYDSAYELLYEVQTSSDTSRESNLIIAEIAMHILRDSKATLRAKEASLQVITKFLLSELDLDPTALLDAIRVNLGDEKLYIAIKDTLREMARYLVDINGVREICKIGLLSNTELVKEAVAIYVSKNDLESLSDTMEYLMMLGIDTHGLRCNSSKIIDLVPIYIHKNPEILHITPKVLLSYEPDDVINSFLASIERADDEGCESLLQVLTCYFDISDGNIHHATIFTKLIFTTGLTLHLKTTLDCCKALAKTVPQEAVTSLASQIRSWISETFLQGATDIVLGRLEPSKITILGSSAVFLGHVQDKLKYDESVKWNLELLVTLLASDNEFSKADIGSHGAAIVASLARKCALEGEDEMLNTMITNQLTRSFTTDCAIVPCVSLLRGGGLSYLKKHDVIAKIKDSLAAKTNHRAMLIVKELAIQFDRLLDPYVKEIFPKLLLCLNESFDICLDACIAIVGLLTPVGLKSILPMIIESLGGYVSSIKLGCLLTLSHVIKDTKFHTVIIKNICDVVKAVSPCTTDTQKPVKEAADRLLDAIVGLAGKSSILYPTMGSILKVLSHPSEANITSTMHLLFEHSQNHQNIDEATDSPIGVIELGLLEPILSRALRSRNGECRQSAIIFSSWLVSRCGGSREVDLFFTSLMPILTDLLKDTLPDIRRDAAIAIGSCAHSFKRFGCDTSRALMVDLINCLTKCIMEASTSLERRSGAAGLAQALCAVEDEFVHAIVTKLLNVLDYPESTPQMREGCLALFTDLPLTCYNYTLAHLDAILARVMAVLCDEDERVREMSSRVMRTVIERYHDSAVDVVLDGLKLATHSKEWQSRNLVLPLLQYLNTFTEDHRITVELYIARFDTNPTVRTTSMTIWKGVNVTRSLRQVFPLVLQRVIEMLEEDDDDIRTQAGECISDVVVRLGSDAVKDFIRAILNCEGAYRGRCIGIAALASNGKAGIEEHLPRILQFLKSCLCRSSSCQEASTALATLAAYFPSVVSEVLPSLVSDLFASTEKDTYLEGITLLIEQHSECFDMVLQEALKGEVDIMRLALLERVLCAKRTKVIFSRQAVLAKCLKELVLYNGSYPTETMSSLSNFVLLVKAESIMRLLQILIEMLNDMAKDGNNAGKCCLILFISRVVELRETEVDGNFGTLVDSLARFIFCDATTIDASLVAFDQLIKSAEKRTELDSLIAAFSRFFTTLDPHNVSNPSLTKTLPLMMSLVQKGFVKSNAKIEAAKCAIVVHKLVGIENMGPFILKTIGAIIRCLNDKCPSILKIALLEAVNSLLHCETVHVRVILHQLQSALFKCLTDVNSDVNMLIGPNLHLYVKLAPNKADSVMNELFKMASDKLTKPSVKTASLHAMNEVLKAHPVLNISPFDKLLLLLQDSNGGDKQFVCQAIGLAAQLENCFETHWLKDLCIITTQDPVAILAFSAIVSKVRGFTTLYENALKDFVDILRHSMRSDVPSLHLSALDIFCRISKLTRSSQLARDFVKSYINMLPSGSKLPPSGQSQVLQIYKRFLRFEQNVPNFGSQLLYLSEAIYGTPLVKLEAEKVLLVLLTPSRDLPRLQAFLDQHSTSDKVNKLLSEYATRVLLKGNKVDQLSDYEV
ncbi:HEAT repeat family protein, putative [Babesia ovis]|uniref:HEAT repeat family protein, putative n=1 Tax=Babesia ovis TaxID=5869 RepID=A0A9W5TDF5_BABOV|nr:HEAT repeat family protein, putative [Babesia ovis]